MVAAAAWAGPIYPPGNNVCGAGNIDTDPATIEGEAQFDLIYDNLCVKIGDEEVPALYSYDEDIWDSCNMNPPDRYYEYMMVRFHKPSGYTTGDLYWQIWGGGDLPVFYAYRWNTNSSPHAWDFLNSNAGGDDPRPVAVEIPASYFDANGYIWLLFKGYNPGSPDVVKCNVVVISY